MLSSSPAAAARGLCSEMRCCCCCWWLSEVSEPLLVAVSDVSSSSPAVCDLQDVKYSIAWNKGGQTRVGQAAKQNWQTAGKWQAPRGFQAAVPLRQHMPQAAGDCLSRFKATVPFCLPGERLLHHQAQRQRGRVLLPHPTPAAQAAVSLRCLRALKAATTSCCHPKWP